MSEEERAGARVVKLFSIVALDCLHGAAKLGRHVGKKVSNRRESVRFKFQRKRP